MSCPDGSSKNTCRELGGSGVPAAQGGSHQSELEFLTALMRDAYGPDVLTESGAVSAALPRWLAAMPLVLRYERARFLQERQPDEQTLIRFDLMQAAQRRNDTESADSIRYDLGLMPKEEAFRYENALRVFQAAQRVQPTSLSFGTWYRVVFPILPIIQFLDETGWDITIPVARFANGETHETMDRSHLKAFMRRILGADTRLSKRVTDLARRIETVEKQNTPILKDVELAQWNWDREEIYAELGLAICEELGLTRCPICGRWRGRDLDQGDVCAYCSDKPRNYVNARWFSPGGNQERGDIVMSWANEDRIRDRSYLDVLEVASGIRSCTTYEDVTPEVHSRARLYAIIAKEHITPEDHAKGDYTRRFCAFLCEKVGIWKCPACGRFADPQAHACPADTAPPDTVRADFTVRRPAQPKRAFAVPLEGAPVFSLPASQFRRQEWANASRDWYLQAHGLAFDARNRAEAERILSKQRADRKQVDWWIDPKTLTVLGRPLLSADAPEIGYFLAEHRREVEQALQQGESVSVEVLVDYPDLLAEFGI